MTEGILVAMTTKVEIPGINYTNIVLRGYADRYRINGRGEVEVNGLKGVIRHKRIEAIPNGHSRFYTGTEPSNLLMIWVDSSNKDIMYIRAFEDSFTQSYNGEFGIFTFQSESLWCVSSINSRSLCAAHFLDDKSSIGLDLVFRPELRTTFSALKDAVRCHSN